MQHEHKGLTRRDFLKGAAVGALGLSALGAVGFAPKAGAAEISFDREVDVLIVGAGGAGLAAGYEAVKAGANTLVLEKSGIAGGTSARSGGIIQAAGTPQQKAMTSFQDDTPEKHFQTWMTEGEGLLDEALVRDMADGAPETIRWFAEDLGIEWTNMSGHAPVPYLDESLWADRIHGSEVGGGGLTVAIQTAAEAAGLVIEYNTEVTRLITDDNGAVLGVEATVDGANITVKANKGVILCASTIDFNKEMCREMNPQQLWALEKGSCACVATNIGDGIRMGMEVGAGVTNFGGTIDLTNFSSGINMAAQLFPVIFVNKAGKRFVCEDTTYSFNCRAVFQQEMQLGSPVYGLFGASSLIDGAPYDATTVEEAVTAGTVLKGETIADIAAVIGADATVLESTLTLWNAMAAAGADVEYGRRTGVAPIEGPYYAQAIVPNNLGAIGGLTINVDTQVLKADGTPIAGLYAAGMNSGGWIGPYYPGSGTALAGSFHFGRKAGKIVAAL